MDTEGKVFIAEMAELWGSFDVFWDGKQTGFRSVSSDVVFDGKDAEI